MTNKPTLEEEFEQLCSRVEYGEVDTKSGMQAVFPKPLKKEEIIDFISTKLEEQRKELVEKIEELDDGGWQDTHEAGFEHAKELIINIIKQ